MASPDSDPRKVLPSPPSPEVDASADAWERTVSRDVLVGQKVGEYVVRSRIGVGGMGVVYEAEQPLIGLRVAIKLLRPDRDSPRSLLHEARATLSVRHRGIVDVSYSVPVPWPWR